MEVGRLVEVMSWVMGFGRHAEVLEPAPLRQEMTQGQRRKVLEKGERFNFEIQRSLVTTFLVPKMTILWLITANFGSLIQVFQYNSLARPQRNNPKEIYAQMEKGAKSRAGQLLDAHRRVRTAARLRGLRYKVEPHLPPDVLGIYVYLPVI